MDCMSCAARDRSGSWGLDWMYPVVNIITRIDADQDPWLRMAVRTFASGSFLRLQRQHSFRRAESRQRANRLMYLMHPVPSFGHHDGRLPLPPAPAHQQGNTLRAGDFVHPSCRFARLRYRNARSCRYRRPPTLCHRAVLLVARRSHDG